MLSGTATSPVTAPTAVIGDHWFRTLARGGAHSCGIDTDGVLWCWGNNSQRQLGIGLTSAVQVTVPTIGNPPAKFTVIAAGAWDTCD